MSISSPFDDVKNLADKAPPMHHEFAALFRARKADLFTGFPMGKAYDFGELICAVRGIHPPASVSPLVTLFIGGNAVANDFDTELQKFRDKINRLQQGDHLFNQLCGSVGAGLKVYETGTESPTRDIRIGAALTEKECVAALAYGMEAAHQTDLIGIAADGPGTVTCARALLSALYPDFIETVTEKSEIERVKAALNAHKGTDDCSFEKLRRLGGREIAATCGAILSARHQNIPVIIDGLAAHAALAVLHTYKPYMADGVAFADSAGATAELRFTPEKIENGNFFSFGCDGAEPGGALALCFTQSKALLAAHTQTGTLKKRKK